VDYDIDVDIGIEQEELMMKMDLTASAQNYLTGKGTDGKHIFLALDDGSSKFSKLGGSCAIGNKFQIVISPSTDPDYTTQLENNADLDLTYSNQEATYLGNHLILDYKMGLLKLSNESGMIDGAVSVQNYEPKQTQSKADLAKDMKEMGNKIC
jgi:hypothetical protein